MVRFIKVKVALGIGRANTRPSHCSQRPKQRHRSLRDRDLSRKELSTKGTAIVPFVLTASAKRAAAQWVLGTPRLCPVRSS